MAIAKVILNGETLMDTTQKTVTANTMLDGTTALKNDGTGITGNIVSKSSSDLTASGATVTAPAGYYPSAASKSVASGSATTPATSITANPTISVNASGLITASVSGSQSVTPSVSAGYVSSGTAGTVSVSGSKTQQLTTQAAKTVAPTENEQTAVASGVYTTGAVKVGAISSTYVGSDIAQNDSDDLTVSGATVTAPAGYYAEAASKSVATTTHPNPTASVNSATGLVTASHTQGTGYVTGGTTTGTMQLSTQAAAIITPSTSQQTAVAAGKYTTGAVTVDPIPSQYIVPAGTKEITENGEGIDVSAYASVDVAVPGQTPTGTKYIWTEQDGDGAWDVSGYAYCSVNGAMVDDNIERWWILVNETLGMTVNFSVIFQMANYPIVLYWGDGTSTEVRASSNSQTITTEHTYSEPGMKVIEYSISSAGNPNYGGIASPVPLGQTSTEKDDRIIYVNFAGTESQNRNSVGCRFSNSLRKITFDSHVTSTHSTRAFNGCTALDNVVIPATLTTIANQTFYNCTGLKSVTCLSTTPPTLGGTGVFYNVPTSTLKIYVPASALDTYKSATNWSTYASCMEAIPE